VVLSFFLGSIMTPGGCGLYLLGGQTLGVLVFYFWICWFTASMIAERALRSFSRVRERERTNVTLPNPTSVLMLSLETVIFLYSEKLLSRVMSMVLLRACRND
jgi:hypothetical protein